MTLLGSKEVPSTSKKQHNFMAAVANSPAFAKKVGIKQSVGAEFMKADKGRKFAKGGMHEEKGEMKADVKQDKAMIKKAVGMHDKQLHGGKKTNLSKLARGGGIETKGKTKGTMIKMCGGGMAKKTGRGR